MSFSSDPPGRLPRHLGTAALIGLGLAALLFEVALPYARYAGAGLAVRLHVEWYGADTSGRCCGVPDHARHDPWGNRWLVYPPDEAVWDTIGDPHADVEALRRSQIRYSAGPNGVDERGQGDDVLIPLRVRGWGGPGPIGFTLWCARGLLVPALVVGWAVMGWRALRAPRSGSLELEVRGALLVVCLPGALALLWAASAHVRPPRGWWARHLLVSFPLAATGTAVVACFLAVLFWRLRKESAPAPYTRAERARRLRYLRERDAAT